MGLNLEFTSSLDIGIDLSQTAHKKIICLLSIYVTQSNIQSHTMN